MNYSTPGFPVLPYVPEFALLNYSSSYIQLSQYNYMTLKSINAERNTLNLLDAKPVSGKSTSQLSKQIL